MNNYLSFKELDEIGECIILSYLGVKATDAKYIDIENLAKCLGLKIVNVAFAETDMSKAGFLADGISPLHIKKNGKIIKKIYPEKTLVIDSYFQNIEESNRRRFLIAHEIAHYIINRISNKQISAYNTEFDLEKEYSIDELKNILKINESQADHLAAAILMPKYLVVKTMNELFNGKNLIIYGNQIVDLKSKPLIKQLSNSMGVSYKACFIRLKDLNLFEKRDMSEYLEKNIGIGGLAQ